MALPTNFPEANFTLTGGPAEKFGTEVDVLDLPTFRGERLQLSCWRLSWRERLRALLFGRVWIHVVTPDTHPPIAVDFRRTPFGDR